MSLLPNPAKSTAPLLPPTAHLLVPLPPNHEGLVSARCTSFAWQQTSKRVHWWLIDPFLGSARNLTPPSSVARAAPACASWSPPVRWHAPLDSADIRLEGPSQRASVDIRLEGPSQRDEFAKEQHFHSFFLPPLDKGEFVQRQPKCWLMKRAAPSSSGRRPAGLSA